MPHADEAGRIVAAAEAHGQRLLYGENLAYAPIIQQLLTLTGDLGPLTHLEVRSLQGLPTWGEPHVRRVGRDALFDLGVHPLAVALLPRTPAASSPQESVHDSWAGSATGATSTPRSSSRTRTVSAQGGGELAGRSATHLGSAAGEHVRGAACRADAGAAARARRRARATPGSHCRDPRHRDRRLPRAAPRARERRRPRGDPGDERCAWAPRPRRRVRRLPLGGARRRSVRAPPVRWASRPHAAAAVAGRVSPADVRVP